MFNRTRSDRPAGCPKCAHTAPLSKTNNFLAWCEKNGELGKKLSREYVDKDKPPTAVTKASHYKALWKCSNVECKHVWRAQVNDRTRSDKPNGCPMCANNAPASKTKNFLTWCEKNGERGKKLSREYVDKDKPPTAVTKGVALQGEVEVWEVLARVAREGVAPHDERHTQRVSGVQPCRRISTREA